VPWLVGPHAVGRTRPGEGHAPSPVRQKKLLCVRNLTHNNLVKCLKGASSIISREGAAPGAERLWPDKTAFPNHSKHTPRPESGQRGQGGAKSTPLLPHRCSRSQPFLMMTG
jgi:hypothetical protein